MRSVEQEISCREAIHDIAEELQLEDVKAYTSLLEESPKEVARKMREVNGAGKKTD